MSDLNQIVGICSDSAKIKFGFFLFNKNKDKEQSGILLKLMLSKNTIKRIEIV